MPRPSRNVDQQLLASGRELYPAAGAGGLSLRRVAEHAGVNLGMFHYHFGNKEAFVRAVLASLYEPMFAELEGAARAGGDPVATLRGTVGVIARFGRDNRRALRRVLADALGGEPAALDFVRENFPRHVRVIVGLVGAAQQAGRIAPLPLPQAVAFLAGAVAAPILVGSAIAESDLAPPGFAGQFDALVLSDHAITQRIDLALFALAARSREPS